MRRSQFYARLGGLALAVFAALPAHSQTGRNSDPFADREIIPPEEYEAVRATRVLDAVRIDEEIVLDGFLEEAAWSRAEPATDFIQVSPRPGAPSSERTEVRFLYDADNLYVGYDLFDSDVGDLTVNDLREDFNFLQGDAISLTIDSLHDRRSGFIFAFNPAGAQRDGQISNDSQNNADWDGVWDVRTRIHGEGWSAEMVIPFRTLRFSTAEVQDWGMQLIRRIPRRNEESGWAPIPVRFRGVRVSIAGTLTGLENLSPGRNLKVTPFFTAGVTQARVADRMETTRSLGRLKDYDGGVNVKYSLTPSLTLDTTYRTDFAQVEVDQQQVNLTRFNLFFPEKREFFLENAGTFNFGPGGNMVPFFSRRIGLSPDGSPIPIVGGGRVTGQIGRYDLGFLAMNTQDAETARGPVPSNTFVVGRLKRNFLDTSWIGALVTSRTSAGPNAAHNRVYGADAHFRFYERLEFDSYLMGSETPGRSGRNQARRFQTAWRDDELRIAGQYDEVQENFNPEVGFVRRGNLAEYAGELAWLPQMEGTAIRNFNLGSGVSYIEGSTSGDIETRVREVNAGVLFQSSASMNFAVTETFDRLTAPARIQGIEIPAGDYNYLGYSASAGTNNTLRVSGTVRFDWGEFWNGRRKSFRGGLDFKPNLHLNMVFSYDRNSLELSGRSTTGDLAGARFLYAFTSRVFLNAFFQYNSATDEVSSNIRFNWKYRPLSDIYIVYNDRRDGRPNGPLERAFIVKVTNLINF